VPLQDTYERRHLALHCHLRPPVSPVVFGFNHVAHKGPQPTNFSTTLKWHRHSQDLLYK